MKQADEGGRSITKVTCFSTGCTMPHFVVFHFTVSVGSLLILHFLWEGSAPLPTLLPMEVLMSDERTLTWPGVNHSLVLTQKDGLTAVLKLVKDKGPQDIPISFPPGITLAMVEAAWKDQGENWFELIKLPGTPFVAIRVIWLPNDQCLMWTVVHIDGGAHDACSFAPLTRADWKFGALKVVAVP